MNGLEDESGLHEETQEQPPSYDTLSEAPPPPYSPSFINSNRIFDIPEGPPDYFSLFSSRIQEARRDSSTCCEFVTKIIQTLLILVGVVILFIILMSVPFAMLGVGSAYYGQCSIEPLIPIFMIVFGLCGILKSTEILIKHLIVCFKCSCIARWKRHSKLKYLFIVWRVLDAVFNLVSLAWVIAGSYWIFHVYGELQESGFDKELCHPVLYKFAFGMMISCYIVVGLTCCCVCGCSLCQNPPPREEEDRRRGPRREGERREGEEGSMGNGHSNGHSTDIEMRRFGATNGVYEERVDSPVSN